MRSLPVDEIHSERVLILDFGSQYTQLIARRVREAKVYSEVYPYSTDICAIKDFNPKAIIFSGGPESVTNLNGYRVADEVFELGLPILGICYGMQTMAEQLGGTVASSNTREFGHTQVQLRCSSCLLGGIQDATDDQGRSLLNVWMSHGDHVVSLPPGFVVVASSDNAPIVVMEDESRRFYGLQFHPEVTHTAQGQLILKRFLYDIAGCHALWSAENIIGDIIATVKQSVGDDRVLLALSGGVDSSVVAALLHRAIGTRLICIFVDNGLLRLAEADQVMDAFTNIGIHVLKIDAERRFLDALAGIEDPEQKRKIIGHEFIAVFEEQAHRLGGIKWLAQGTIYPDVIESACIGAGVQLIKSHHNVGGLPKVMKMGLIEPLCRLFKDEVRQLGLQLGLPASVIHRHPFPGPGLGIRIVGAVKKEYADLLRQVDHIFIEELHASGLYEQVDQAFAVFLPVRSVGIKGDVRRYEYVIVLRAAVTTDFMTAHWAHLPYRFLEQVSNRIINETHSISRVTYDISSKPPATIEWE